MALGPADAGPGIAVPATNSGVENDTLTTTGEYVLTAVNANGELTVTQQAAVPQPSVAPDDVACSESEYELEGQRWTTTDKWYYNESTASQAGLSVSASLADLRQANSNMTLGINNCGYAEGVFTASGAFQGDTSKYANIDASGHCTSNFPDGQNTVSWQRFTSSGTLAITCRHWNGSNVTTEADTGVNPGVGIVDSLPSPCSSNYDLQTVMTHEWGHVYGLAHDYISGNSDEVMWSGISPCRTRRHLGKGDYNGMAALY